ncbi:hypothetical protein [Silvanigrella aquatica]|uniref:Uncharacterized protein n=1 Tax=Silvanigrella aquatica TaxID=1915309 RepID=A0A1L4D0N7_9BACT|nr:hypothetical protein [Silvanigrella aquatica]APJ03766.1 hypothetical protein AXG55_07545 [Silvanigrella aquatica]
MSTTSSIYSKKGRNGRFFNLNDAIGSEIESYDIGTNALFKVALFTGIAAGSEDISDAFLLVLKNSLNEISKISPYRLVSLLSFPYFSKKFIVSALLEIKNRRSQWLLSQCDASDLSGLDSKSSQFYFTSLEKKMFEEYVATWPNAQNCLEIEFKKVRKRFIITLLKKYFNFILFWCLILLAIYIGLHITSQENSLTMWEQLRGWINFVFQRLR